MNTENDDQLGAGLVYEDLVPMSWRKAEEEIQPAQMIRVNDSNEEILRFMSVLDDYHSESAIDARGTNTGDIARLEYKVNLILDVVSQILVHHVELPPAIPIKMTASGIQWLCDQRLSRGQYVFLDIYFHHGYPRPIVILGKVQDVDRSGSEYNIQASFEYMSDVVRRWLDKLIFRQHRRSIALSRRQQQADDDQSGDSKDTQVIRSER